MNCIICHKKLNPKNADEYVLLKGPGNKFHPVCENHKNVKKEYDNQIDERLKNGSNIQNAS